MVVTVFGLGFVGLTTAVGFAEKGITVYGMDVDTKRMDILKEGRLDRKSTRLNSSHS